MYERFTDRARKVMQLANQAAQRLNHEYVGTEHILLGLIAEHDGVAAHALKEYGCGLDQLQTEVEKLVQKGPDMVTMGKLPHTPRAKRVIENAIVVAQEINDNHIGTEHLLLGILKDTEGAGAQALLNLGVTFESMKNEVLRLCGKSTGVHMRFHIRVDSKTEGHVFFTIFANGANCGAQLAMTPAEFKRFGDLLEKAATYPSVNTDVDID